MLLFVFHFPSNVLKMQLILLSVIPRYTGCLDCYNLKEPGGIHNLYSFKLSEIRKMGVA
jgi:hypothetical protein